MSLDERKIYDLLPVIYRIRDTEQGGPLKELISVIARQVAVLEENMEQLYDDQFIETCAEWVVPYIGDLIGIRNLSELKGTAVDQSLKAILSRRAQVANTIAYRRRKGTAAVLEQLARDTTLWHARVVEFFRLLAATQYMNHVRTGNITADIRHWESLKGLGTPFDSMMHTIDVRRIENNRGCYNIPNIGIFLWRLHAYPVSHAPAYQIDNTRFFFNPLGTNMQLFNKPQVEGQITHIAEPVNLPVPLDRCTMNEHLNDYYGEGKGIFIEGINSSDILVADLSEWQQPLGQGKKAVIDPVLGRIAFQEEQENPPAVSYHYGFSMDMGGGEYERGATFYNVQSEQEEVLIRVPADKATIKKALNTLKTNGVIEITDNRLYRESLKKTLLKDQHIQIRAANGFRPVLVLDGDFLIKGDEGAELTLNGLLISGGRLCVLGGLQCLRLHHCTLVPGISLKGADLPLDTDTDTFNEPIHPDMESLRVESLNTFIEIDYSIIGGLRIIKGSGARIRNSIIDATSESRIAWAGLNDNDAGGDLYIENSTIIGKVYTSKINMASNSIFLSKLMVGDGWPAPVVSEVLQEGCMRFSYVPLKSLVPRRYNCQPTLAIQQRIDSLRRRSPASPQEIEGIANEIEAWLKPGFTSLHYGDPGYCQLHATCPVEISRGADDEEEMGVFHNLLQQQRQTNLKISIEEYLRFALEAGIFYVT